jgi:hypothetical protein
LTRSTQPLRLRFLKLSTSIQGSLDVALSSSPPVCKAQEQGAGRLLR